MVKIALTVVAGIDGLVALLIVYRWQEVTDAADRRQHEVAADIKQTWRITELYTPMPPSSSAAYRRVIIDRLCTVTILPSGRKRRRFDPHCGSGWIRTTHLAHRPAGIKAGEVGNCRGVHPSFPLTSR